MSSRSVLPPFVLENIARNGDADQRERALATMALDSTLRAARIEGAAGGEAPRGAEALADRHPGSPSRTILDAHGSERLADATTVRGEGDPAAADAAVNEAYDGLGATYAFWWQAYGRDSIDDDGLPLRGIVHYGSKYDNAFWDGRRMVFGDGDGDLFTRFTRSLDVIGHELAHGVTQDEARLRYLGQAGALNESISDVFGSLVKQFAKGERADQADWLIGADLLTTRVHGRALRSLAAPGTAYDDPVLGKDPQPATMEGYVVTTADHGGVHVNSGIPNRAFYLVATALGGHAWERAGRIWYETLRSAELRPSAQFATFARITHRVAGRLFGARGTEAAAVRDGWAGVGIAI